MSDPSAELRPALEAWLRGNAAVITAFAGKPVKIYGASKPPVNTIAPYVVIPGLYIGDALADCIDATEIELAVDVWSLTDPPGYAEVVAREFGDIVGPLLSGSPVV